MGSRGTTRLESASNRPWLGSIDAGRTVMGGGNGSSETP